MATIRNPIEWGADHLKEAGASLKTAGHAVHGDDALRAREAPQVRKISFDDLKAALAKGVEDFGANRSDVIFLAVIYPIAGLLLARAAFNYEMLPMLFPLASGFALLGPVAAIGLYELSRRRERGLETSWSKAFAMVAAPSFGAIVALGLVLLGIFFLWLAAAQAIYQVTLGPELPASTSAFVAAVFTTGAGWAMILLGIGIGFLFAVIVLAISVVSFPLLIDRDVGLFTAIGTSLRAVRANPVPMAAWGLIVAGGLVLGSLPLLLGLIFVMPVLGHATWHLYRRVVE
ncbi:MAG: DUF2189 domain-containing protein [Rhodovibrionaceae bacterium]